MRAVSRRMPGGVQHPAGESAQAITEPVPQEYLAAAQEAADSCPVGAIELK